MVSHYCLANLRNLFELSPFELRIISEVAGIAGFVGFTGFTVGAGVIPALTPQT